MGSKHYHLPERIRASIYLHLDDNREVVEKRFKGPERISLKVLSAELEQTMQEKFPELHAKDAIKIPPRVLSDILAALDISIERPPVAKLHTQKVDLAPIQRDIRALALNMKALCLELGIKKVSPDIERIINPPPEPSQP